MKFILLIIALMCCFNCYGIEAKISYHQQELIKYLDNRIEFNELMRDAFGENLSEEIRIYHQGALDELRHMRWDALDGRVLRPYRSTS